MCEMLPVSILDVRFTAYPIVLDNVYVCIDLWQDKLSLVKACRFTCKSTTQIYPKKLQYEVNEIISNTRLELYHSALLPCLTCYHSFFRHGWNFNPFGFTGWLAWTNLNRLSCWCIRTQNLVRGQLSGYGLAVFCPYKALWFGFLAWDICTAETSERGILQVPIALFILPAIYQFELIKFMHHFPRLYGILFLVMVCIMKA